MTIQQAILDIIFIVIIQILIIEFIDIFHSDILFFLWMVPIRTFDSFVKFQNIKEWKNSTCWLVLVVCNGFQSF